MIIPEPVKRISLPLEYISFLLCLIYWFFYSIARVKGVPVLFSGLQVNSMFTGILVSVVLFFNSLFFSRLFVELMLKKVSLRTNVLQYLFRNIFPVFLVLSLITFITGGRFDYASYKLQWDMIIAGENPWGFVEGGMVNAYGYIFNFLAILHSLHSLLPKLFFVLLLGIFCRRLISNNPRVDRDLAIFLCINPFTVSTLAVYGFSDGLCSLLLGLALLESQNASAVSSFRSGLFISLSILSKFYSIVALPIFIQRSLRSNQMLYFAKGLLITSILVLFLSYFLWGNSILTPLLFAQGREPSFLTVWKFVPHVELRTFIFSTVSLVAVVVALARKDLPYSLGTAGVLSVVFGAYYLGHQQFYLGILASLTAYITEASGDTCKKLKSSIVWSFGLMLGWLIFIQTGFELFDEFKPIGFQELSVLFSYLNTTILVASGFYWLSIEPATPVREATVS